MVVNYVFQTINIIKIISNNVGPRTRFNVLEIFVFY